MFLFIHTVTWSMILFSTKPLSQLGTIYCQFNTKELTSVILEIKLQTIYFKKIGLTIS